MNELYKTFIPEGFNSVSTYLFVEDAPAYLKFLKTVFYAEELSRTEREPGIIANCVMKIGNTNIMISQATGSFMGMKTALYLYVNNVEATYNRALEFGCESVFEAQDMDYGDRQAGVRDAQGTYWWISTRLEEKSY